MSAERVALPDGVALAEDLAWHRDADVTSELDKVLAEESSDVDPALRRAQARSVRVPTGIW